MSQMCQKRDTAYALRHVSHAIHTRDHTSPTQIVTRIVTHNLCMPLKRVLTIFFTFFETVVLSVRWEKVVLPSLKVLLHSSHLHRSSHCFGGRVAQAEVYCTGNLAKEASAGQHPICQRPQVPVKQFDHQVPGIWRLSGKASCKNWRSYIGAGVSKCIRPA